MNVMFKNIILLSALILVLQIQRAYAPNMWADYSFTEIQTNLKGLYLIDQEIIYEKNLKEFKFAIAFQESSNDWKNYNPYGYIGKFQFGQAALQSTGFGYVDFVDFMNNPSVFPERDQEKAMDSLLSINEFILGSYISEFEGAIFLDSVRITKTGLLAAAHLAGPGNVKRFLKTKGSHNPQDQMGTRLSDYLVTFGAHFH